MSTEKIGPMRTAYLKSMKIRGMDGPIDLYLYRPLGFLVAWPLSRTGMSPNAVTLLSALFGLAAGCAALPGTASGFLLCAILFQASNCFDCADGQLARMTGKYSRDGRLLDGFADYSVNVFVLAGVLVGLLRERRDPVITLFLVLAGGGATALSCLYYDRAITRFADFCRGKDGDEAKELGLALEKSASVRGFPGLLWRLYALYLRAQKENGAGRAARPAPEAMTEAARRGYLRAMYPLLGAWSFTGPSAHVLYFLVFAAAGRMEMYLVASVALAIATALFLNAQQAVDLKFGPTAAATREGPALETRKRPKYNVSDSEE